MKFIVPMISFSRRKPRAQKRVEGGLTALGWLGERFLFPSQSDHWLSILRIGLGLQLIVYAISSRRDWIALYSIGPDSLVSRDLTEAILTADSPLIPRLGWLTHAEGSLGLSEPTLLFLAWLGVVCAGAS